MHRQAVVDSGMSMASLLKERGFLVRGMAELANILIRTGSDVCALACFGRGGRWELVGVQPTGWQAICACEPYPEGDGEGKAGEYPPDGCDRSLACPELADEAQPMASDGDSGRLIPERGRGRR